MTYTDWWLDWLLDILCLCTHCGMKQCKLGTRCSCLIGLEHNTEPLNVWSCSWSVISMSSFSMVIWLLGWSKDRLSCTDVQVLKQHFWWCILLPQDSRMIQLFNIDRFSTFCLLCCSHNNWTAVCHCHLFWCATCSLQHWQIMELTHVFSADCLCTYAICSHLKYHSKLTVKVYFTLAHLSSYITSSIILSQPQHPFMILSNSLQQLFAFCAVSSNKSWG